MNAIDKSIRLLAALLLAVTLTAPFQAARAAGEREAIERLNDTLQAAMRGGGELGFQGRFDLLEPVLGEVFDFRLMTRIGLQRYWDGIAEADRAAIIDAFRRMSVATYASRFDGSGGISFSIGETREGPQNLVLVPTVIERAAEDPVSLTYVMRDSGAGPAVIDVLAQDKFSELARQRAEMSSVFGRSGAAGLIETLNAKTAELAG
ncbi:ABC transporter substrate-binding protein [Minwuia thermotolerans]|uniref:Hopanoid biosynthesis protein HpnM n=1 Tax=Minwuia thermotolerans TaxID=2056226 RepID=A0A2M9G056_9PROT|nr:ABC transporter substrate-binding protein [Minwuia thermotolerans]PJK29107.1 hopanoid biosynthesis protein HpnM [Minwuia thermotolerans]